MVSRGALQRVIAVAVVLMLAVAGLVALAQNGDSPDNSDAMLTETPGEQDSADGVGSNSFGADAPGPLVATTEDGELVPPRPSGTKTGATTTSSDASPPTTSADQAYLEQTRAVVQDNADDLAIVAQLVTAALGSGDRDTLESVLVADEGDVSELAEDLAGDYPPIITSQLSRNVDVFAAEGTTLYFAYAIVTWTDGGITSQHTIPIALRFMGGEWRLSSLAETGSNLAFVQSVDL